MKLIPGSQLTDDQRRQALAMYVHRNTADHPYGWGANGHTFNVRSYQSDAEWLAEHAFLVTASGKIAFRRRAHSVSEVEGSIS
jgi:hypothetical protein